MVFKANPIKFGTDGWRGVIAADFTFERVAQVAPLCALVLREYNPNSNLVVVGYDRRFLAEEFARVVAESLQEAGFDVLLSRDYAPTPAFSWAAKEKKALGALVITASHNPPKYLGLKVKGSFGGSVGEEVTRKIENLLHQSLQVQSASGGSLNIFDPWDSYCQQLRQQVNIDLITEAIDSGKIKIAADVMHGAAASGLGRLLGKDIIEINSNRDPLFGGGAPEPLPRYITELFNTMRQLAQSYPHSLRVGFVFDGDSDRIAVVDGEGNFCSTQLLIPILIEHLAVRKKGSGEVVKTVSGSDLIPKVAQLFNLPVTETAIGYKYIAERMLSHKVLLGGEESGGVGYGHHIPERDALLSALYLLEAMVESGQDIRQLYDNLRQRVNFFSEYDRIDLPLESLEEKNRLQQLLTDNPLTEIAGKKVINLQTLDGYKYRLEDNSWILFRFSGTEPLLRIYSEGSSRGVVEENLHWAKQWATEK
ncbi:MAG: phosphoglucomutase/phosphomannomutase family protein [Geminocystis sp.]|nr:phosphoglucomutase/phosphomannomutase family protein [Geminocystis sp.]MDW8117309.1 phosphoglucomutase/phosphomannomutase family protein [Geminocystis sp.]